MSVWSATGAISATRRMFSTTSSATMRCASSVAAIRGRTEMDLGLTDKVAVVGGASDGIGFAIATMLAAEGAHVAMVARRREKLDEALRAIAGQARGRLLAIPADIRRADDCERIIAAAKAEFGGIDLLVINDGAPPIGPLLQFDDQAWAKAVD